MLLTSYSCGRFHNISCNKSRVLKFKVWWFPGFMIDPLLWGGLHAKHSRPWNIIHLMPWRSSCRFCIHLSSCGPHALMKSELGQSWPFPRMTGFRFRSSWVRKHQMLTALRIHFIFLLWHYALDPTRFYSSLEVASEYFRSGADKISIGSDAVYAAEEFRRTGVSSKFHQVCSYFI